MSPANGFGRGFAEPQEADFPFFPEPRHLPDSILDRNVGIDAMLIVKVDHFHPEPPEARVARRAHIFGVAANAEELPLGSADVAELGREEHLVATIGDRLPDQFLILADAIHVGGIEEGHAALDGVVDGRDRFALVAGAVELAHAHAAKADRRDFRPAAAQLPLPDHVHVVLLLNPCEPMACRLASHRAS